MFAMRKHVRIPETCSQCGSMFVVWRASTCLGGWRTSGIQTCFWIASMFPEYEHASRLRACSWNGDVSDM